jgi:hypothetical protein
VTKHRRPRLLELFLRKWRKLVRLGPTTTISIALTLLATIVWINTARTKGPQGQASKTLGIQDLTKEVRSELSTLVAEGQKNDADPMFLLKNYDLEISFQVKEARKENGTATIQVVTVGGEQEHSSESTHKVTLHFEITPPHTMAIPVTQEQIPLPADVVIFPEKVVK